MCTVGEITGGAQMRENKPSKPKVYAA